MPTHKGFKVWMKCEDEVLKEYDVEPDSTDGNVINCWVTSEAGKQFTIHYESLEAGNYIICAFADGVWVYSRAHNKPNQEMSMLGMKCTDPELGAAIRLFHFAKLSLSDDDSLLDRPFDASGLGTIKIEVYHATVRPLSHRSKPVKEQNTKVFEGPLHETTKKLLEHRVTLGEAISLAPSGRVGKTSPSSWTYREPSNPCMVFAFRYRPHAFLLAQGIVPSLPDEPVAENRIFSGGKRKRESLAQGSSSSTRPDSGLTPLNSGESLKKNKRRSGSLRANTIKRDADEVTLDELRRELDSARKTIAQMQRQVKQEPTLKLEQIATPIMNGEVIDLTVD
ncbi:hypothetical protein M0805_007626 [Coniferiporia weirii]|nr:hypothetical protein M0805_007626 [Coniferiporia weirii]